MIQDELHKILPQDTVFHQSVIRVRYPIISDCSLRLSRLEINSTEYKKGAIVILDAPEDDAPLFGEITHVIAYNVNEYLLITKILITIGFVSHYHAYEVEHNQSPTCHITQPSSLIDHHTLGLYICNHPQPTLYVSLKYNVISTM